MTDSSHDKKLGEEKKSEQALNSEEQAKAKLVTTAYKYYVSRYSDTTDSQSLLQSQKFQDFFLKFETSYVFYAHSKYDEAAIPGHLNGIDFSKPVNKVTLVSDDKNVMHQMQLPDLPSQYAQGCYYAKPGYQPTQLGISDKATYWGQEAKGPQMKYIYEYKVVKQTVALETTAAAINDTWSIKGTEVSTKGGAIQYFCADKEAFSCTGKKPIPPPPAPLPKHNLGLGHL